MTDNIKHLIITKMEMFTKTLGVTNIFVETPRGIHITFMYRDMCLTNMTILVANATEDYVKQRFNEMFVLLKDKLNYISTLNIC